MTFFWLIALALTLAVVLSLALPALRLRGDGRRLADYDIDVYRAQLDDLERDVARGVIPADTAERTRLEISRRILDADRLSGAAPRRAPRLATGVVVAVLAIVLVAGTGIAYLELGVPGYGDLPHSERIAMAQKVYETRPDQADAEARIAKMAKPAPAQQDPAYVALVEKLRQTVAERGDDPQGLQLLAESEANLGRYDAAEKAQSRLIEVLGDKASAQQLAQKAEFDILAANGYVSPEAETALRAALAKDSGNGAARYYMGLMYLQTARPDLTFNYWAPLLQDSKPDAPWVAPIRAQITDVAARAGVEYEMPAAPTTAPAATADAAAPGPDADQVAAAQQMSPQDRQAMIRNMVSGLEERLHAQGGSAEEWARLIKAQSVLGDTEKARETYTEALATFAKDPDGQETVRQAAKAAGLDG